MTLEPDLVLDVRALLGEGPVWDASRHALVFVDIHRAEVHEFEPGSRRHRVITMDRPVSALAPTRRGDWIAAAGLGFARIDPVSGALTPIVDVEPEGARRRMNDGAVDPAGRFWAGSMSLDGVAGQGTLYRLDSDLVVSAMVTPVTTSNGPAWSPDHRLMYYVDTRTRAVDVYDFDAGSGSIANRRPFARFETGAARPDGVIVDRDGGVWVALWQGGAVHRYAPDGSLDLVVSLPTPCPTKCAFGDADLGTLYVTTARAPLGADARPDDPAPGGLYGVRPGTCGQPGALFG